MSGKGRGVSEWEAIANAAKDKALAYRQAAREYVGEVPARAVRLTPDEKAQKYLPDFYARGMARGPVGLAYWTQLLQERGPKGMTQLGRELVRLMDSPKHWATPITASSPAQQRQTALLRLQGSHAGVNAPLGGNSHSLRPDAQNGAAPLGGTPTVVRQGGTDGTAPY